MRGYDLIVIGGGSAGLVAAAGAAQLGARVALVERKALGGDCLFTGCVPSKTLIRSARFAFDLRRAEEFGFAPLAWQFETGEFDAIAERIRRVVETVGEHDAPERFRRMGVEIIFGVPRFVSPRELEIELLEEAAGAGGEASARGSVEAGAEGGRGAPASEATDEAGLEPETRLKNQGRSKTERRLKDERRLETETRLRIRGRRFCIATGSRPLVPQIEGLKEAGFITNEEVFHVGKLPRSLIVLGAGPVGLEIGQSLARLGSRVTVVEMGGRVLPKEDEEVSAAVASFLRAEGLEILLDTKAVSATRAEGGGKRLTVEHEGRGRTLEADEILLATGRRPNTEGLNLELAGVAYDAQRVLTDALLRTTARHIYAAGDITGHYPFTHMAAYEGALVVRNALFFWPLRRKADFRVVPWATFTDPEVARVGLTEREARERFGQSNVRVYRAEFADNDRAQAEGEIAGFAKIVCAGRRQLIAGASIVGRNAGELIHEVVLAMKERLPVTALAGLIHVYPTLTQVNQQAGLDALLSTLAPYRKYLSRYFALLR